jgi:uncharacterized protein YjiK
MLPAIMGLKNRIFNCLNLLLLCSCSMPQQQEKNNNLMISPAEYNLNRPELALKLPKELKEISGISYYGEDKLLAIQDEHGIVFLISLYSGEILESIPFGKDGDYEGIASDKENIYVLRSDGNIYTLVLGGHPDSLKVKSTDTPLNSSHDTEGICFDRDNESLLIACKEKGEGETEELRNIYRYRPKEGRLEEIPAYSIRLSDIRDYLELAPESEDLQFFTAHMKKKSGELFIYPSDIAVHPISGDVYICSARGINALLVLSPDGKLKCMMHIPEDLLEQPEGICFNPQGDLIISSEGKPKKERLFLFKWNKK